MEYKDFDLTQIFGVSEDEPAELINLKRNYIFLYITIDDLNRSLKTFKIAIDPIDKLYTIRQCLIPLANIHDNQSWLCYQNKDNEDLQCKWSELANRIEFANNLRDFVGGHLSTKMGSKAIQWNPFIFSKMNFDNPDSRLFQIYTSIFETGINIANNKQTGKVRLFKDRINIIHSFYNKKEFLTFVEKLLNDSIEYLELIAKQVEKKLPIVDGVSIKDINRASKTKFQVKL